MTEWLLQLPAIVNAVAARGASGLLEYDTISSPVTMILVVITVGLHVLWIYLTKVDRDFKKGFEGIDRVILEQCDCISL